MGNFKFWEWDKKPRTMLRFIKQGDIFCFNLGVEAYRFGRIMAETTVGHVAEIFDITLSVASITEYEIENAKRACYPVVIDTYSLFDKKIEKHSDWRIIGHQDNYMPEKVDDVYFAFGADPFCKKKDIWGNVSDISKDEWDSLPKLSPKGDFYIKKFLLKNN